MPQEYTQANASRLSYSSSSYPTPSSLCALRAGAPRDPNETTRACRGLSLVPALARPLCLTGPAFSLISHSLITFNMLNLGRGRFNFLSSWTNTKQEKVSPQTRLCLETQFIPQEKADWVTSPTHGTGDTTVCTCQSHHRRGSAPGRTAFEGATEPKHRDAPRGPQQQQEGAWETCAAPRSDPEGSLSL